MEMETVSNAGYSFPLGGVVFVYTKPLILIAEDEPEIAEVLAAYLTRDGMDSVRAEDGERALELHQQLNPALVLLDVQMPRTDGWKVLSGIRSRGQTPVIMLTAMDQDIDKLTGLRIGADDYVVKPFNPAEVVARVQAVLRRSAAAPTAREPRTISVPPLEINLDTYEAAVCSDANRQKLDLTLTEFKLLAKMAAAPRRVFNRLELLHSCLPQEGDALERTVDSHVSKLRKKLGIVGLPDTPFSVRGVGYRLFE